MKSIGPFLNRDLGGFDRPRALFSGLPVGVDMLCDYVVEFEDFLNWEEGHTAGAGAVVAAALSTSDMYSDAAVNAAINAGDLELASAINKFIVIKDTSASVAHDADAASGVLKLLSQTTTDDDGASIQKVETQYLCKSGVKLWFEARVKVSDADQCDMFVGLADNFATNPEGVWAAGVARVGFELRDGSASIVGVVDNDTATTDVTTGKSASDDTFVRLGFRTDGGSIRYYVNRSLVGTASIPAAIAAVTLGPAFAGISGNNTGTHTRSIDYFMVAMERQ